MAVVSTSQKLNIASGLVAQAQALAKAWRDIQYYNQEYVKSGLSFTAGDFDNSALTYINPSDMGTLITQLNAVVTWMNTNSQGDIFFKLSPGT